MAAARYGAFQSARVEWVLGFLQSIGFMQRKLPESLRMYGLLSFLCSLQQAGQRFSSQHQWALAPWLQMYGKIRMAHGLLSRDSVSAANGLQKTGLFALPGHSFRKIPL